MIVSGRKCHDHVNEILVPVILLVIIASSRNLDFAQAHLNSLWYIRSLLPKIPFSDFILF